jgi:hypothetical protein
VYLKCGPIIGGGLWWKWPNIRRVASLEGDILVVHLKSGLKRGAEFDGQALLKGVTMP